MLTDCIHSTFRNQEEVSGVDFVLAVDIGASKVAVASVDLSGEIVDRTTVLTRGDNCSKTMMDIAIAADYVSHGSKPRAVGAGVACPIDEGVIGPDVANMSNWTSRDLRGDLSLMLSVPAATLNDCAAAALGEYAYWGESLVYMGLGSGNGIGVVNKTEGEPRVEATEFGHMIIDRSPDAPLCGCGGRGHWEAFTGGVNLPRRFGCEPENATDGQWSAVLADDAIGIRNVSNREPGKPIFIGGGRFWKQRHRFGELVKLVNKLESTAPMPELRLACHGEDSALIGAAYAAWQLVA